jgi:hypothetical protein
MLLLTFFIISTSNDAQIANRGLTSMKIGEKGGKRSAVIEKNWVSISGVSLFK